MKQLTLRENGIGEMGEGGSRIGGWGNQAKMREEDFKEKGIKVINFWEYTYI